MEWYYIDESRPEGNRRNGPWSLRQMLCFAEQGAFSSETLVWNESFADWQPWGKCNTKIEEEQKRETEKNKTVPSFSLAQVNSASLLLRISALLIDFAILQFVLMLLTPLYGYMGITQEITQKSTVNELMPAATLVFVLMFSYDLFFVKFFSGTPGKIVLGLAVIRQSGKQMSWGCSFLRAFIRLFFWIGWLIVLFDPEKRALHDYISNTKVMKLRNASVS